MRTAGAASTAVSTRLLGYCEASACRRVTLLEYFGERTRAVRQLRRLRRPPPGGSTRRRTHARSCPRPSARGERFGAAHLIDILRGAETEKVARFGHRRLPAFGAGADRDKNRVALDDLRQMVATGFLRLDIAGYGGLGITDKGRALLHGEGEFLYREDRTVIPSVGAHRETRAGRSAAAEPERPLDGDEDGAPERC